MKRFVIAGLLSLAGAVSVLAQAPAPAPAQAAPAAKQPQPKSKGEVEALQAMFNAQDPDARIKAADNLVTKFSDTDFKDIALFFAAASYEQKGDTDKAIVYGERAVEANPKNYSALLMLARLTASKTREHDLDREDKLTKVENWVKSADAVLKDAPKPNPSLTDEQWTAAKKDLEAQGHEALGFAAMARKKYDVAANEYKTSVDMSAQPDPATMVRLANAYNLDNKPDSALPVLDKVLAMPDAHPTVKQFAQAERVRALQAKGAVPKTAPATSASPAPAPAPSAPPAPKP